LPFLLAMLLQLVFGFSAFASGMITFTSAIGSLTMKFTVSPIVRRFGFRSVLVSTGLIGGALLIVYASFRPGIPMSFIITTLLVGGFFRSLQFTCLNTLAYADVNQPAMSSASTLASMAQQLFLSVGVTIAALTLHLSLAWRGATQLDPNDFAGAFIVIGLVSMGSILFFVPLAHHAGAEVSGHPAGLASMRAAEPMPEAD